MGLKVEQRFLLFWSILGLGVVILIWNLSWQFQLNDDVIMMWLVSGVYTGQPESFAVFIHPILSWCFSKLYTFFPLINWYPTTWFFIMFCSFVVFLSGIWKKQAGNLLKCFFSLFLFALVIHFLFFLQFTVVAAFAVGAGLFIRLLKFGQMELVGKDAKKQYSVSSFFLSDGLILIGALMRMEILFLMMAGVFVLGTLVLKSLPVVKALVLPGIGLVLCFSINQAWIYSNELNHFDKANRMRSSVFDDPILQLRKDAFQENFPDLYSFSNGLMDFNREADLFKKMETWKDLLHKERFISLSPSFFLKAMTYFVLHERYFCFLMGLLLAFSFINHFKFTLNSLVVLLGIMIVLSPFFLLKIQIYLTVLLVFLVVFLLGNLHLTFKNAIFLPFFTLLLGSASFHSYSFLKNNKKFFTEEVGQRVFGSSSEIHDNGIRYLVGWDTNSFSIREEVQKGIRFLGWPTLLLKTEATLYIYLVKREVYEQNLAYFESFQIKNEFHDYLELEFRK